MLNSWFTLTSSVAVFLLFLLYIDQENKHLLKTFGQEYEDYKKETGIFIPRLK
jgi:protein-S-isoprenylcysteine O-methyltransferase Ste14